MNEASITIHINTYFGFLLNRGFHIQSVKLYPEFNNWKATLQSQKFSIELSCDRDDLSLYIGSDVSDKERNQRYFDIDTVIYYLSDKQIVLGRTDADLEELEKQFQNLANILSSNLDKIIALFGIDFDKHANNLLQTRKTLVELYLEMRYSKHKAS